MNVKIYSTSACPYCNMAKQFLSSKGISYENVDVSSDPSKAEEMVKLSGQTGVPVIVIDGNVITGFDQAKIEELIKT